MFRSTTIIRSLHMSPANVTFIKSVKVRRYGLCDCVAAKEGVTMGEKWPRILPKVATSTSLLGSFTCRKFTTCDRRRYFPSERRRAEDFFSPELGYQSPARLPLDHRSRCFK